MAILKTRQAQIVMMMITLTCALIDSPRSSAANPEWDEATRQYTAGDYKAAAAGFRKIADRMPSDPSTHYMLVNVTKG